MGLGYKGDDQLLQKIANHLNTEKAEIKLAHNEKDLFDKLQQADLSKMQFVIIILNQRDKDLYTTYKKYCNEKGIVLQCIVRSTLYKPSVLFNIGVQIQAKMGFAVWKLNQFATANVLIAGLSVQRLHMTNQFNGAMFSYRKSDLSTFYSQKFSLYDNMKSMLFDSVTRAVAEYHAKSGTMPTSVVLYVEGTTNFTESSEFSKVQVEAVQEAIEAACAKYQAPANSVGLTYVDVMKRVTARFVFKDGSDYVNAPLGSVIDSKVQKFVMFNIV